MRQQFDLVVDCARMVGSQRGIEVFVPQTAIREDPPRVNGISFALACAYTELGVRIYNACIFLLHPRRGTPRILASDYWRNIEPVMSRLPQGELVLFDRGEALKAGLRNLWRKRVRLYNFGSFSIRGRKKDRMEIQRLFEDQWRNLRKRGFLESQSDRSSLDSLSIKVFEEILLHSVPQALRDIDSAYAMLDALTPDMVFLRAGVSEQTHFGILAMVAHASRIPSLELQHGVEYLGPGSVSKRHVVEYVAVYGQVVQDEFANLGFPREKFPIVGSPRFDIYKKEVARVRQKHREDMSVSVLCIGFGIEAEWPYDDYSVENYYSAIAKTLEKIPHSSVVIKIRPGSSINSWCRSMIDRIFANVPHRIAEYEPLCELFVSADIVVSYYSTSVLEALQFSKPIIVFSTQPMEKEMIQFRFTQFADAGGLVVAYTRKELETALLSLSGDSAMRDRLARGAKEVLGLFYLFDGKASERVVELIWRLAQRRE